jgi:hypothetical protein
MSVSRRRFLRNTGGAVLAPSLMGIAGCNDAPTETGHPAFTSSWPHWGEHACTGGPRPPVISCGSIV